MLPRTFVGTFVLFEFLFSLINCKFHGNEMDNSALLNYFYFNDMLPYVTYTGQPGTNYFQSSNWPMTLTTAATSTAPNMMKQSNNHHYHNHYSVPANQIIANLIPKKAVTSSPSSSPKQSTPSSSSQPFSSIQMKPTLVPSIFYGSEGDWFSDIMLPNFPVYLNSPTISGQTQSPVSPKIESRRHFGAPVPGPVTDPNFDKIKTIDEVRGESMNPLIRINLLIRDNIKRLRELESNFQSQPIVQRFISKMLLRAFLNPLK